MPRCAFTSEALDIEYVRELGSRVPDGYRLVKMDPGLATKLGYTPQGTYSMLFYTGSRVLGAVARAGLKAKDLLEG